MLITILLTSLILSLSTIIIGQDIKVGIIDTAYLNKNIVLQKWIREDLQSLVGYLEDAVLLPQRQKIEDFYQDVLEQSKRCDWGAPFYMADLDRQLQEWQTTFLSLAEVCDTTLMNYEKKLLKIKEEKLKQAVTALVDEKGLEYIVYSEGLLFSNVEADKHHFSAQISIRLNKNLNYDEWKQISTALKEKLIQELYSKGHFLSTKARLSDVYTYSLLTKMFLVLCYYRLSKQGELVFNIDGSTMGRGVCI